MPVQERDYAKGGSDADTAAAPQGWLAKLNQVGEKHATAIIAVSTGLIILTVLLFAKGAYDRSQIERAELELGKAASVEQLAGLKTKFGSGPLAPRILYKLAARYADDGKLESAQNEYREFLNRFPQDALQPRVALALKSIEANLEFERERKPLLAKAEGLQSHPLQLPRAKDPRLEYGPVHEPNPQAEIEIAGGVVKVELLEDEAPNAVANFVALAEQKYFDGLKIDFAGGDERLQTQPKAEGALEALLAYEATTRAAEAGSLVLVKKGLDNQAGGFQILLRSVPDLKDATVFGLVQELGLPVLRTLKKDDVVKSVKVVSKRGHAYEPKRK
jgi:cyclophilin family peptidyl-prolyl cis-trans isomerase